MVEHRMWQFVATKCEPLADRVAHVFTAISKAQAHKSSILCAAMVWAKTMTSQSRHTSRRVSKARQPPCAPHSPLAVQ